MDGVPARGWRLEANGRSCAVWDAVPGVMEAAAAVAERYVQLARLHGRLLPEMPVTHEHGRMRLELLDREPAMAEDVSLFEVPESFRRMEMAAPGAP